MTETDGGLDLDRLLRARQLSPAQAAAVGLGLLTAVEDLHEAGRSAGALGPGGVLLGTDGRVRLRTRGQDHPSSSELMDDLRQAGKVICTALGIPPEAEPGSLRQAERSMPAVCATARAIANGGMGRNVTLARASFADTAGSLVASARLRLSESELAELARGAGEAGLEVREMPPPAPSPPRPTVVASVAPATPPAAPAPPAAYAARPPAAGREWERPRRHQEREDDAPGPSPGRVAAVVGVLVVLMVGAGLGIFAVRSLLASPGATKTVLQTGSSPAASASAQASPAAAPSPRATPQASPQAIPSYAPLAAGTIKSIQLALNGDCAVGASCALETTVNFTAATAPIDYAWTYRVYDPCTATSTDAGTGHVTAQQGWNHVIGDRTIKLPKATGGLLIVALTTSPDQAMSPPLSVGSGGC